MLVAEVQDLSKRYGTVRALDRVDVEIAPGCTGLVGSNGAGKSTLIKLLLGLLVPDQGRATVLGHDVATDPLAVRSRVGYLPEGACLPGDVTAADFVAFMAQLAGLPPRPARERAAEVCYQVGLEEERYRAVGGFSTGMQQRVKLAVALVHDPSLLLLDEPTDGMDPQGREDMLDLIARIRGELGIDVLVSTHLLGDVERVCDRVVMVHGGHVLAQGSIAEVAGTTEPGFGIQLGDNGPEVLAALAAAGLEARPSRGAAGPSNGAPVSELLVQGPSDRIRDVAAERGWPLRRMVPRAPSLEETFLRLQAAAGGPPPAEPASPSPAPEAAWGVRR
ncbi:MAG TPA: ABC transporter ATP-binding protein [Actinomycetes bacterium]|nr:ABC transporter ATP-binding protein [Actinomycetes bacterium]